MKINWQTGIKTQRFLCQPRQQIWNDPCQINKEKNKLRPEK